MEGNSILQVSGLRKSFANRKIIEGISFCVSPGEVVGLLGPNGAGKTTILKHIAHLLIADAGEIFVNGFDIKENYENVLQNIGVVLGEGMLYDELSGYANLCLRANLYHKKNKEHLHKLIRVFHMEEYVTRKCGEYSLGMRQRLALATACLSNPKLLLLDEPMNGLDPEGMRQLSEELSEMAKEENVAILISSHLLYDVENLCDRVLFVNNGNLIGEKTIESIHRDGKKLSELYFEIMEGNSVKC